jgi:hypothetical protein
MPGLGTILSTAEKTVLGAGAKNAGKIATSNVAKKTATNAATEAANSAITATKTTPTVPKSGSLFSKITSGLGKAAKLGGSAAGYGITKIGRMAGNPLIAGTGGLLSKIAGRNLDDGESKVNRSTNTDSSVRQSSVRGYGSNSNDDSVSFLRIISGDIAEIKDTVNQIHQDTDKKSDNSNSSGLGMLTGLSTLLGGLFTKFLGPIGSNLLKMVPIAGRIAMSAARGLVKGGAAVGGLVAKGVGKLFGSKSVEEGAESATKQITKSGSKTVFRDPKTGRFISKEAFEALSKSGSKVAIEDTSKIALKTGGKTLGKSILKKIPLIGLAAGLGFGAQRAMAGD